MVLTASVLSVGLIGCDLILQMAEQAMKSEEEVQFEEHLSGRWIDNQGNAAVFELESESGGYPPFTFVGDLWPYDWRGEIVGGTWDILYKDGEAIQSMTCWSHNGEYRETATFKVSFATDSLVVKEGSRVFRFGRRP